MFQMNSNSTFLKSFKLGLIFTFIDQISLKDSQFYSEKFEMDHEEFK